MNHIEALESRRLLSTGSISGTVFNDLNSDGKHQASEPGLTGWQVILDLNHNGKLDAGEPHTKSLTGGAWSIIGLAPGTYSVRESLLSYWRETTPATGIITATVKAGQTKSGLLFGDVKKTAQPLVKFTFDGPKFYAPSLDTLGGSTLTQAGNDVVAGGQAGDPGKSLAWNRGVNDGGNALTLHTKFTSDLLYVSFDYRSTAVSATGKSYGPTTITVTQGIEGTTVSVPVGTITLTRDSQWHHATIAIPAMNLALTPKGHTITLSPSNGADLGTLSIDNLTLSGITP